MKRRFIHIFCAALLLVYFPIVMFFVADAKGSTLCNKISTNVNNTDCNVLVTSEELVKIVNRKFPDLVGAHADSINLNNIESVIEQSPVVKRCNAYITIGGVLHLNVIQREPIMRVFTNSTSYYMDIDAYRIPAGRDMKARTTVVNGSVASMVDTQPLIDICSYINENDFWKSQIEQVYVTSESEFILVPRVGDHIILFGKIDDMKQKFSNLKALYQKGWNIKEWNLYSKVNLKYKGQVICTKK